MRNVHGNIVTDDEIDALPFMRAALPLSIILAAAYLAFVLKIGPALMKNKKPLRLKNLLLAYNAFQVALSAYMVWALFLVAWVYVFAKVTELLDTVFFVLRKKSNQVTLLHVYHHTIMVLSTWIGFKFHTNDAYVFFGTFNALVHVFMYAYYGLAAVPSMAKYLWWKKYLTTLQLIQFVSIFIHFQIAVYFSGCPPSRTMVIFTNLNNFAFTYLFAKFYIKNYIKNGGLGDEKPSTKKSYEWQRKCCCKENKMN